MIDGVSGRCHCGAVRFRIDFPTKFFAHCHCEDCRRAHGAAFVSWVGVPAEQFMVEQGADDLVRYDSSGEAHRRFCRRCGTTLTFEGARWAGEVHVAAAALEGALDRPPAAHVYFDRRVPWAHVGDALPRLGGPDGTSPIPELAAEACAQTTDP